MRGCQEGADQQVEVVGHRKPPVMAADRLDTLPSARRGHRVRAGDERCGSSRVDLPARPATARVRPSCTFSSRYCPKPAHPAVRVAQRLAGPIEFGKSRSRGNPAARIGAVRQRRWRSSARGVSGVVVIEFHEERAARGHAGGALDRPRSRPDGRSRGEHPDTVVVARLARPAWREVAPASSLSSEHAPIPSSGTSAPGQDASGAGEARAGAVGRRDDAHQRIVLGGGARLAVR